MLGSADKAHKQWAGQHDAAVQRIDVMLGAGAELEFTTKQLTALTVGRLTAGGNGAAGIPPSSIHAMLPQSVLALLQEMNTGLPVKSTILQSTLPDAVSLCEARIKLMLKDGVKVSLYIDGGSNHLAYGRKVMAVCASSLEWNYDLLLDVQILEAHETGRTNADQIHAICSKYDILKKNVWYICADNASVNTVMVDKLNKEGFCVTFARCLPHCASLAVSAFLDPIDANYKFSSHLRMLRGFLNAGGGFGKHKRLAIEYGLSISSIDFTDTRWASLVKAICYLVNKQPLSDLATAREMLQELADEGDAEAGAAVLEADKQLLPYNVIFHFVESVAEGEARQMAKKMADGDAPLEDKDLVKNRRQLLTFFSDLTSFTAAQLVDIFFGGNKDDGVESLSTIMTISQGRHVYDNKLNSRITGEVPHAASAAKAMLNLLRSTYCSAAATQLEKDQVVYKVAKVKEELLVRLKRQTEAIIETSREAKEMLSGGDWDEEMFEEKALVFQGQQEAKYPAILDHVLDTLGKAAKNVHDAAGAEKLRECVEGLEVSQHFDINKKPPIIDADEDILRYLGCSDHPLAGRDDLITAWQAYVSTWKKPPPPPAVLGEKPLKAVPPCAVFAYWKERSESDDAGTRRLGALAMRAFSRPVSAACCERIFSYLEKMDDSDRRTMKKATLRSLLFLRGNWRVMDDLAREHHAERLRAELAGKKRKKMDHAVRAAQQAGAAGCAAAGGGAGQKQQEMADDEEVDDVLARYF
jgi:hypothetical protein